MHSSATDRVEIVIRIRPPRGSLRTKCQLMVSANNAKVIVDGENSGLRCSTTGPGCESARDARIKRIFDVRVHFHAEIRPRERSVVIRISTGVVICRKAYGVDCVVYE